MQAIGERNTLVAEKDEAVRQVVALQDKVQGLQQEVQEARAKGTPIGEGEQLATLENGRFCCTCPCQARSAAAALL